MTAVTNPMTRHVSVLASLAQTVEELAPGRLTLVVGSGYSAVNTIGRKAATLNEMRESVANLKSLLAGDNVDFGGFQARLPYAAGRRIPVLLAATGPRTIELAGEVADGAMLAVGLHPGSMDAARSILHAGARKAGRDPDMLDIIYLARVHVADDLDAARDMARPICAQWALEPYRARWLREAGVDLPHLKVPPELEGLYPDIPHAENWEEARRLTSFLSDDLVAADMRRHRAGGRAGPPGGEAEGPGGAGRGQAVPVDDGVLRPPRVDPAGLRRRGVHQAAGLLSIKPTG